MRGEEATFPRAGQWRARRKTQTSWRPEQLVWVKTLCVSGWELLSALESLEHNAEVLPIPLTPGWLCKLSGNTDGSDSIWGKAPFWADNVLYHCWLNYTRFILSFEVLILHRALLAHSTSVRKQILPCARIFSAGHSLDFTECVMEAQQYSPGPVLS